MILIMKAIKAPRQLLERSKIKIVINLMKKIFFLISLAVLFLVKVDKVVYANPFYTPSFRFLPADKLQLSLKEIYARENNFGLGDVTWRSDIAADMYYGINKDTELDLSFPYTSGGTNKQSGSGDSQLFLKYRIFSNQGDLLADRNLDIALQLGGKVKTGESKKGLGGKETDLLCSLLGKYEIGQLKGDYFFYFHLGEWFPVAGDYKYKNIFQYDFAFEYQSGKKISFFMETNGEKTPDYNLVYMGPGIEFRPGTDWKISLSVVGSVSDTGGFVNSKSAISVAHVF
ncbi:MAG: hypothetical protein PHX78_04555 [bacterium]|nr:hypothetical protein [bacterium]